MFKLADTNNDGQISQKEATDVGNLLVGGFFFRADANGDGVLTPDEAQQARESLFAQQPLLRFVLAKRQAHEPSTSQPTRVGRDARAMCPASRRTWPPTRPKPLAICSTSITTRSSRPSELRQGVQTGVQSLFLLADTNQDGLLSPYELNSAVGEVAKIGRSNGVPGR